MVAEGEIDPQKKQGRNKAYLLLLNLRGLWPLQAMWFLRAVFLLFGFWADFSFLNKSNDPGPVKKPSLLLLRRFHGVWWDESNKDDFFVQFSPFSSGCFSGCFWLVVMPGIALATSEDVELSGCV